MRGNLLPGACYLAVIAIFALGLLAKPMLVTAPLVLLLLDYWPLGRIGQGAGGAPMYSWVGEQGAGSKEWGAGSGEQGTGSGE